MPVKKNLLKILAHRRDVFGLLPQEVLDDQAAVELSGIPRLAVADFAGPADTAPLIDLIDRYRPDGLLPTVCYTGTEHGDWEELMAAAAELKKRVERELRIFVAAPVVLGSPALWSALSSGGAADRFGFACRCLGCLVYRFVLRVPLCRKIGAGFFIPSAQGLLQRGCPAALNPVEKKYLSFLMSGYGVDVWHQEATAVESVDGPPRIACVLPGEDRGGIHPDRLTRYFEGFALPAAGGILSRAVFGAAVDYADAVAAMTKSGRG